MPSKKSSKGKFQKGVAPNPKGSSKRARELGKVKKLTNTQVQEVGTLILEGNRKALQAIGLDKDASVLKVWMAGLVIQSMKKGDAAIFRAVLDRMVGKPKETVEVSGTDGGPVTVAQETRPERLARVERLRATRAKLEGGK